MGRLDAGGNDGGAWRNRSKLYDPNIMSKILHEQSINLTINLVTLD